MSASDATVVLVHGAWADGSSWTRVIGPLAAEGVQDDRRTPAADLPCRRRRAALDRTLERAAGPVVLAGHAYAGAVIAATRAEQGQGPGLCRGAGAGRGRDGRRTCSIRAHAASPGAEACAGRHMG